MANDYVDKITLQNGNVYDIRGGTKLYKHVVKVGQNYEEYAFELITTDATQYTSSTFDYSGIKDKLVTFCPIGYAGGSQFLIGVGTATGPKGDFIFINSNNNTIYDYSLANVYVRSDTVTEL